MSSVYLSRLVLNPRRRDVQRDLADCHGLHQRILAGFPTAAGIQPRNEFGILYRVDLPDPRTGIPVLLVQSRQDARWDRLPPGYLLDGIVNSNPEQKEIGEVYDRLDANDRFRFRLRANPTKRVWDKPGETVKGAGKRVEIYDDEKRIEWLNRKGGGSGFQIETVQILDGDFLGSKQQGWKQPGEKPLTFGTAVFDGVLRVTEPNQFRAALETGIGSGKAYGYGLLSIGRV